MAQAAEASMTMHDFNLLSDDNVAEDWKEGENCRKGRLAVDDEKRDIIDFESIRKVSDTSSPLVCVCDNNDLVPTVDQLRRELVDVAFDAAWLGEEGVADHRDIVRHGESRRFLSNRRDGHRSS